MNNPKAIIQPPNKDNITYHLMPFQSLEHTLSAIVEQRKKDYPRTIIYCLTLEDVADAYLYFQ